MGNVPDRRKWPVSGKLVFQAVKKTGVAETQHLFFYIMQMYYVKWELNITQEGVMLSPRDHHPQQTQIQSLELYPKNESIHSSHKKELAVRLWMPV